MRSWKKGLWKTNLRHEIFLKLTQWEEALQEQIYWTRARRKRKSPQHIQEMEKFASARLLEVLPHMQKDSWDFPEGYVSVVAVEHIPLPSIPDAIPADPEPAFSEPQFEASDSQPEVVEAQSEVVDLPFESGELSFEAVDPQAEAVEPQPETVDMHAEAIEPQPEAEEMQPETGDLPVEVGEGEHEVSASMADEMAANFFGFGDWAAPYWFIGLESGKAAGEESDTSRILRAWANGLQKGELVDCLEYHQAIGVDDWHKDRAKLQPTWRPLMLFLMTALERDADREALRDYQRTRWGQIGDGETCVIDLPGIRANGHAEEVDREEHLAQRIGAIRQKIMMGDTSPRVVVLHGLAARSEWEQIAGVPLEPDTVVEVGSTLFVMTPSPTAYRRKNSDWENLGLQVRERLSSM